MLQSYITQRGVREIRTLTEVVYSHADTAYAVRQWNFEWIPYH